MIPPDVVEYDGWKLTVVGGEPAIADDVLAEHLLVSADGVRKLIKRHAADGNITPISNPATVARFTRAGKSRGSVRVDGYLLTQADALFVVTRSEAPKAIEMTKVIIRVFLEVGRRLMASAPAAPSLAAPSVDELVAALGEPLPAFANRQRRVLLVAATCCDEETLLLRAASLSPSELRGALVSLRDALGWIREAEGAAATALCAGDDDREAVSRALADRLVSADVLSRFTAHREFLHRLAVHVTFGCGPGGMLNAFCEGDRNSLACLRSDAKSPALASAIRVLEACLRLADAASASRTLARTR